MDEDDDHILKKPYECLNARCKLTFTNKDHLDVHSRLHEISLSLTPSIPFKNMFVDETPTPTRFLKSLESEYFHELSNDNPFDATFRRANSNSGASHTFVMPESSSLIANLPDSEVLNTPSITLPSEPETPVILKTNFCKIKYDKEPRSRQFSESTSDTLPFTPNEPLQLDEISRPDDAVDLETENENISSDESSEPSTDKQKCIRKNIVPNMGVVQTPVITSIGNSSVLKPSVDTVPTAVIVSQPTSTFDENLPQAQTTATPIEVKATKQPQATVQSVSATQMLQLMLQLPDGQTIPIQFPVMSAAPTSTFAASTPLVVPTPAINATTFIQPVSSVSNTGSVVKTKLKEVLTRNRKSVNSKLSSSTGVKKSTKPCQPVRNHANHVFPECEIASHSSIFVRKPGQNGRRRPELIYSEEEKRKISLERNRAAASRSRKKKKIKIKALEKRANINSHLQNEVSQLRNEVAQLKARLLDHKDCSVTLQQKRMSRDTGERYNSVHFIHPNSDDVQRVPNCYIASPSKLPIHTNSELSSASDAGETSCKEK